MAVAPQQTGRFQSKDVSGVDLSSHQFATAGTGGVRVSFEWINVEITSVDPEHNGTIEPRLAAFKQPLGDRRTIATELLTPDEAARKYPQEYALFSQYDEVPSTGTPLREVPGLSQSQIGLFSLHGLRSAEDVASLSESQMAEMGISGKKAARVITAWLKKRDEEQDLIDAAEAQARHEAEKKALEDRLKRLEESNMGLQQQLRMQQPTQGVQPQQQAPAPQQVQAESGGAMNVASSDDLPYDLSDMPNPMTDGPGVTDGSDDMGRVDPDPLSDE